MEQKKWKMLGVRVTEKMHRDFFKRLQAESARTGRPMKASEVIVPAIKCFLEGGK